MIRNSRSARQTFLPETEKRLVFSTSFKDQGQKKIFFPFYIFFLLIFFFFFHFSSFYFILYTFLGCTKYNLDFFFFFFFFFFTLLRRKSECKYVREWLDLCLLFIIPCSPVQESYFLFFLDFFFCWNCHEQELLCVLNSVLYTLLLLQVNHRLLLYRDVLYDNNVKYMMVPRKKV